jgi:predicted enzyme related to lactoylglutathione lyase
MAERTTYEPGMPCWVDLTATDLDAALSFYGGLFGWEFQDLGEETGHYHEALLRGKRVAGLGPAMGEAPPTAYWTTYLCSADADKHAAAIKDAGGQVMFGPMDVFDQGRMVIAQDPTGAMFGVWQPQEHKGAQLVNENATLTWNDLMTRDLEGATRFYGAAFGLTFEDLPDTPSSAYQLIKVADSVVAGIWAMTDEVPAEMPPSWLTYFFLDDVDAGFERVRELGGELMHEPTDTPYARYAPVQDPHGGAFSLIQAAEPGG